MLEKATTVNGLITSDYREGSERREESCRESLNLLREHLSGGKQNVGRTAEGKGHSDEASYRRRNTLLDDGGKQSLL